LRKRLAAIAKERLNIRNNVEATIFQGGYHYRGNKSRYRGKGKHHIWALMQCMWINFRRILLWRGKQEAGGGQLAGGEGVVFVFLAFFRQMEPLVSFAAG